MNDCIEIRNLIVFANHGVMPEEKTMGQKFMISMKLYNDMSQAAKTDDINKAVNYAEVCSFVTEFTKQNRCKLIEAAAENIANALLVCYPTLSRVDITLKKPWAPIGLPLDSVAVELTRKRHIVYIGIGSNMGDKQGYLDFAVKSLEESDVCNVRKVSRFIVTKPYGGVEQDDFLNGCIELDTVLEPKALLDLLHEIENKAERKREVHWGPRTLDLDILLYDDMVMHTDTLTIPHPEMAKREFVLSPLTEIAPYAYNPVARDYAVNMLERIKCNDNT
ncbi:MAG: 2-amino-4-hydroxy-6-hydroxymethyldihydropteridine diphosphokinase [Oscillospiraceae bacterium]|nr:2-amino-4-hydroxy-6-hydroxymethyldihydropteridine diphosphokinase [Oscillospiraceae bacterium]